MDQDLVKNKDIWNSIVLVHALNDKSKKYFGTGFVLGHPNDTSTMILTCGHVVRSIGKSDIAVDNRAAKLIADAPDGNPDLAVLLVEEKIDCPALILRRQPLSVKDIEIHGYYQCSSERRLSVIKATNTGREEATHTADKRIRTWNYRVLDSSIFPGYSGAPAMLTGSSEVIGVTTMKLEKNCASVISIAAVDELQLSENFSRYLRPFIGENDTKDMKEIFQQYKALKKEVIRLYEEYRNIVQKPVHVKSIENKIEEVKEDRFTLALAGEVKAGKSTFINALLGEMILPTGFLQSTSAIIEIFHNRQKCVEVVYGNGVKKRIVERSLGRKGVVIKKDGENKALDESKLYTDIAAFLRATASIQEKYRKLPFQQLNALLVECHDKNISSVQIDKICEEYNTYNVEPNVFRSDINRYIQEFRDLSRIPIEIKLGYPLKSTLEELRIIDTPGVNAIGGVESITYDYLSSADAIIFLHSAESPIENASFKTFVENEATDRVKGNLFLAITKSGMITEAARDSKLAQAKDLFSSHLSPERIVHVDSLLKITSDHAKDFRSFDDLISFYKQKSREYKDKNKIEPDNETNKRSSNFYSTVYRLLRNLEDEVDNIDGPDFQKLILEQSKFDNMIATLGQFSSTAPFSRVAELLRIISSDYESEKNRLLKRIQLIHARISSSERFQEEINTAEAEIQKTKEFFSTVSQEVQKKYINSSASWVTELKSIVKKYKKKAEKRLEKGKKIKKVSRELTEDLENLAKKVIENVFQELSEKTKENSINFDTANYSFNTPKVAGMGGVIKETKAAAYKTESVKHVIPKESTVTKRTPGWLGTGLGSGTYNQTVLTSVEEWKDATVFDKEQFIAEVMDEVKEEFNDARDTTESKIDSIIRRLCNDYEEQGNIVLQERSRDLDELRQRQFSIEECNQDIASREKTLAAIDEQMYAINPILIAYKNHIE